VYKNNLLDIIIINWNSASHLRRCVDSILSSTTKLSGKVIIVDNLSTDGSLKDLNGIKDIQILQPPKNLGFGGGCNLGFRQSQAQFLLFLNPDIQFLPDSQKRVVDFLNSPKLLPETGIIGVLLQNPDGSIQKNVARFPRFIEIFPCMVGLDRVFPRIFKPHYVKYMDYSKNQLVDQVPGAFFLVRRSCFEKLGGFDERFFLYYEDVDFSYRAHQVGWNTQYLADATVFHGGGGTTESIKDKRLFYSLRSRVLYAGKHFGRWQALAIIAATLTIEFLSRCARAMLRLSLGELTATLKGFWLFVRSLPETLKKL
jgi:GT2 family glycosyltransferase